MAEKSYVGRRNPKCDNDHWEILDLDKYKIGEKPIIFCLGGNATYNDMEANGTCKLVERMMSAKLAHQSPEQVYESVELLGVVYEDRNCFGNQIGAIQPGDIDEISSKLFYPLCSDEKGNALPVDDICRNFSKVTFFSFCHGALETFKFCRKINQHLKNDLGFSKEDATKVMESMLHVSYSPMTHASLTPMISALSSMDRVNGAELYDYDFTNKRIAIEEIKPRELSDKFESELAIYVDRLTTKPMHDDHFVSVLSRDENWNAIEDHVTSDTVSKMLGYSLARSAANGIVNNESGVYVPQVSLEQLKGELEDIMSLSDKNHEKNSFDEMGL